MDRPATSAVAATMGAVGTKDAAGTMVAARLRLSREKGGTEYERKDMAGP